MLDGNFLSYSDKVARLSEDVSTANAMFSFVVLVFVFFMFLRMTSSPTLAFYVTAVSVILALGIGEYTSNVLSDFIVRLYSSVICFFGGILFFAGFIIFSLGFLDENSDGVFSQPVWFWLFSAGLMYFGIFFFFAESFSK